jgi:predicted DNA-binding transcriptional regulator AlpA
MQQPDRVFMKTPEAAKYLSIPASRLHVWRREGRGPAFVAMGNRDVKYTKAALDAYIEACTTDFMNRIESA